MLTQVTHSSCKLLDNFSLELNGPIDDLRTCPIVQVLNVDLSKPLPGAFELLNQEEQDRASRFLFDKDRQRFTVSHAFTRLFLAVFLKCAPAAIQFGKSPEGKPFLTSSPEDVRFNISHTSDRALIAVTHGREIGIDIEKHRPLRAMELAENFFAHEEVVQLRAMSATDQHEAFFRCWTRKEALVKALGKGLGVALNKFEVSVHPSQASQLLLSHDPSLAELSAFRVIEFPISPGYSAALACIVGPWTVSTWQMES